MCENAKITSPNNIMQLLNKISWLFSRIYHSMQMWLVLLVVFRGNQLWSRLYVEVSLYLQSPSITFIKADSWRAWCSFKLIYLFWRSPLAWKLCRWWKNWTFLQEKLGEKRGGQMALFIVSHRTVFEFLYIKQQLFIQFFIHKTLIHSMKKEWKVEVFLGSI